MKCEKCSTDANPIYLLPLKDEASGRLDSFYCRHCALESGAFCTKHEKIHLGYADGTTACEICIAELASTHLAQRYEIWCGVMEALHPNDAEEVREMASINIACTGLDGAYTRLVWFIAGKSTRSGRDFDTTLQDILRQGTAECILG